MRGLDEIAEMNRRNWERAVAEGDRNTVPHLDLPAEALRGYAAGATTMLPEPYRDTWPQCLVLAEAPGKDVLCLAGSGGQQSAVYGLLGARVTVLDIAAGQLEADARAAEHYGYEVTTVQGDMRDLSVFPEGAFDIVDQPISMAFVPDVREVYREVARVLRPSGTYLAAHVNPSTDPVSFDGPNNGWDGVGYRIAEPYCCGPIRVRGDGSENMHEGEITGEFRHLFSDIFNGLIESGFAIKGVWEDSRCLRHDTEAEPGSYEHMLTHIMAYFTILAQRE